MKKFLFTLMAMSLPLAAAQKEPEKEQNKPTASNFSQVSQVDVKLQAEQFVDPNIQSIQRTLKFVSGKLELWAPNVGNRCLEAHYQSTYDLKLIESYIVLGRQLLNDCLSGKELKIDAQAVQKRLLQVDKNFHYTDEDGKLDAIVALSWGLYSKAVEKNKAYGSGSIVCDDPGNRIWNFLQDFHKNNTSALRSFLPDAAPSIFSRSYGRLSSHLPKIKGDFGIDLRFTQKGTLYNGYAFWPVFLLPTNASHLLYKKLPNEQLFVKFEMYGLNYKHYLSHAVEWGESMLGLLDRSVHERREKLLKTVASEIVSITQAAKPLNISTVEITANKDKLGLLVTFLKTTLQTCEMNLTKTNLSKAEKAANDLYISKVKGFFALLEQYFGDEVDNIPLNQYSTEVRITKDDILGSQQNKQDEKQGK